MTVAVYSIAVTNPATGASEPVTQCRFPSLLTWGDTLKSHIPLRERRIRFASWAEIDSTLDTLRRRPKSGRCNTIQAQTESLVV